MIIFECSVSLTVVLSSKVSSALARAVLTVSFISTVVFTLEDMLFRSRSISVGPVCSVTLPTPAKLLIGLSNDNVIVRTVAGNNCILSLCSALY